MRHRYFTSGFLVVAILGCASPTIWDKAGATQQDFRVDSYNCEKDTRQSGYFGGGLAASFEMRDFYARCMIARGWTPRDGANRSPEPAGSLDDSRLVTCQLTNGSTMILAGECRQRGGTVVFY